MGWSALFEKIFFGLKGVMGKCVGCFLVYLFGGIFFIKNGGSVIIKKKALLPHFYVLLWLIRVCVNLGSG